MKNFKLIMSLFTLGLLFSFASCKPDLTPLKKQALSIITNNLSKLETYKKSVDNLNKQAQTLPQNVKEVKALVSTIAGQEKELGAITGFFNDSKGKVESLFSAGDQKGLSALFTELKDKAPAVAGLNAGLKTTQSQFNALKKAAVAAKVVSEKVPTPNWATKLSTGYKIKGFKTGIEENILVFLNNAKRKVDKKTWFDFDKLTFKTGSANLDLEKSKNQLQNVFEILKAYPKSKVKLGGYTDNTGNAKKNQKLSAKRAKNVLAQLVKLGVDKKRIESEGYGDQHPVCPANDTPECKKKNRRISLRFTAK